MQFAVPLLVPVVTAAVGLLGIMFGDWRQRRTQAGRRKAALEDASRQVSFAAEWWNARKLLADSPEAEREATARAVAWLDQASELVFDSRPPPAHAKPAVTIRRLVLGHPLHSGSAKILRVLLYVSLICMFAAAVSVPAEMASAEPSAADVKVKAVFALIAAVSALLFRLLVALVDDRTPADEDPRELTMRRALLAHRLHRPAARFVRILFYGILASVLSLIVYHVVDFPASGPQENQDRVLALPAIVLLGGCALALRFWAVSLEAGYGSGETSGVASSDRAVDRAPNDHGAR